MHEMSQKLRRATESPLLSSFFLRNEMHSSSLLNANLVTRALPFSSERYYIVPHLSPPQTPFRTPAKHAESSTQLEKVCILSQNLPWLVRWNFINNHDVKDDVKNLHM